MKRTFLIPSMLVSALAAALALPLASGIASSGKADVVSAKMVGKWTRTVTNADVTKSGGYGVQAGSKFTLTVKKSGAAVLGSPSLGPPFTGKLVAAGGSQVHIKLGPHPVNVYAWRVSGKHLTFTKIKDSEGDRVAIFVGTWQRH